MRRRQDLSNKMRRRPDFLTKSSWILCPVNAVKKLFSTNHSSESSSFNKSIGELIDLLISLCPAYGTFVLPTAVSARKLSLSLSLSLIHTHTYAHLHTHTHTHTHTKGAKTWSEAKSTVVQISRLRVQSLSHPLSLVRARSLSFFLSLSHSRTPAVQTPRAKL